MAAGGALLLGAVGQLQFEVVAHRLQAEYGAEARLMPSRYNMARWITAQDPKELRKFIDANAGHIAYDVVEAPAFLVSSIAQLRVAEERYPAIRFHAMREHGGQVFADKV
jgi:peptide chain release factor 3